jgi:hypothetical protein
MVPGAWWRIDNEHPYDWQWHGFPQPCHRFDPPSGRFRVRYGASRAVAAARERFPGKILNGIDGELFLVELTIATSALVLTHQSVLDALGLDDRINTGRIDLPGPQGDALLDTSQSLADAVFDWWNGSPPALVYRTRTVPSARSVAFTSSVGINIVRARPLREARRLLAVLVARHGFTVAPTLLR